MTKALLTPMDLSKATSLGKNKFRKQILPLGSINYKGRKINFDRRFLSDLVRSFKNRAYDQVPFVLADGRNRHNEDPRNFRGSVRDLVLTDDGLDAVLELSNDGAKLISDNPELGVSARIIEMLEKSDGRSFPRAIRHVLATMDPRVTGMRPWQPVDLSDDGDIEVVDLTAESYERKRNMPKSKLSLGTIDPKTKTATIDLSALSDDEFEALVDLGNEENVEIDPATGKPVKKVPVDTVNPDEEVDPDEIEDPDAEEEDPEAEESVVPSTGEQPPATAPASAVKKRKTTVEEEAVDQGAVVASLSNEWAAFRKEQRGNEWKKRKVTLAKAGVPPFLLDLAEPVMLAEPQSIDLSSGDSVDAKDTIEKMLEGFTGVVDLTAEMGHSIDLSDLGDKNDPDKALLDEWSAVYGS
jgi:hypothetical protein